MNETPFPALRGASVLLIDPNGQILLVNRKSGQGVCMPGGKLEDGEDFLDAAVRETFEETGLRIQRSRLVMIHRGVCTAEDGRQFDVSTFLAEHWDGHLEGQEPDITPRWGHWGELIQDSPFHDYNLSMALEGFLPYLHRHTHWTPKLDAWMGALSEHVDSKRKATA